MPPQEAVPVCTSLSVQDTGRPCGDLLRLCNADDELGNELGEELLAQARAGTPVPEVPTLDEVRANQAARE